MTSFEEIQRLADKYFQQNLLESAATLYKQCIQYNFHAYQQIQSVGSIEDQKGYYLGRLGQWYNDSKRRKSLKGSPIVALSLIFSTNSYVNFAKDYFQCLCDRHPNSYQIVLALGHVEANLRNYKRAQKLYQQAIKINPEVQQAYFAIASLYFYQLNDELKARQFSIKALYYNQENILPNIIFIYTSFENFEAKILKLEIIYSRQPLISPKIKNLIGCLLFENKQYKRSQVYFLQSVEQNSRYISPKIGLANIYIQNGLFDEAQKCLLEALKLDPGQVFVLNSLGNVCLFTERYEQLIEWFYASSQCNEECFESYYGLGNSYYFQQEYQLAIEYYQQALQREKNRYQIYMSIGNCYIKIEIFQTSIQYYSKCFQLKSEQTILSQLIKILIICQKYQVCIGLIELNQCLIKKNPQIIYFLKAYCHLMLNQMEKAQQMYNASLNSCPQFQHSKNCLIVLQSSIKQLQ